MIRDIIIDPGQVDFQPGSLEEEIIQNVRTICTTLKGSVPMDRELGVNADLVDQSIVSARARLSAELIRAVRKFEPRCKVVSVSFDDVDAINGKIIPRMKITI